jgi:integrase
VQRKSSDEGSKSRIKSGWKPPSRWTDEGLRALKPWGDLTDERVTIGPNLYIRLRERQGRPCSKTWEYRAQVNGKRRFLSMGAFPGLSLHEARAQLLEHEMAQQRARVGLADHPVLVARQKRNAVLDQPTVAEVFEGLIAARTISSPRKGGKPVRARTIELMRDTYDRDIAKPLGEYKIASLNKTLINACIEAPLKRGAPSVAGRIYKLLRSIVNFALEKDYLATDPMRQLSNPSPHQAGKPNAAHDGELKELLKALYASQMWPGTRDAIHFQLLTGLRPSEVRFARLSLVNRKASLLLLPEDLAKTDVFYEVHLSEHAMRLIDDAAWYRGESEYLFPSSAGTHLPKQATNQALHRLWEQQKENEFRRLKPHDLRKTFRTVLSRLGVPLNVAELCLNHQKRKDLVAVYDGHDFWAEQILAWDKMGAHLAALMSGGAEVIPIFTRTAREVTTSGRWRRSG